MDKFQKTEVGPQYQLTVGLAAVLAFDACHAGTAAQFINKC